MDRYGERSKAPGGDQSCPHVMSRENLSLNGSLKVKGSLHAGSDPKDECVLPRFRSEF